MVMLYCLNNQHDKGAHMNAWNRKKTQYLASCIREQEKQDETSYPADALVDIWNAKYKLVPNEQLSALKNQVCLELDALRGAETNIVTINNVSAATFAFDSVIGAHIPTFNPEPAK
jgi:hypothetical protein